MNNRQNIEQAISNGDIDAFNAAVQKEILSRIPTLGLDEDLRLTIQPLAKKFSVPVRVRYESPAPQPEKSTKRTYILAAAMGLVIGAVMVKLVPKIDWWSVPVCSALVTGGLALTGRGNTRSDNMGSAPRLVIEADADQVMREIDAFAEMIRLISASRSQKPTAEPKARPTLFESYPNVIKWLQNLYASQYEFDEHGQEYLFKHIPRLLREMYYDVVMYDGNNIGFFEIDRDPGVNGTELIYPAVIDTRLNRLVLKGRVCNP